MLLSHHRPPRAVDEQHNHNVENVSARTRLPNSNVLDEPCVVLLCMKGRGSLWNRWHSADWGLIYFNFHFDFVGNLCMQHCLLKHGSVLAQGTAAVDSLRNCFPPFETLTQPRNEKRTCIVVREGRYGPLGGCVLAVHTQEV